MCTERCPICGGSHACDVPSPHKLPISCSKCGRPLVDTLDVRACRCSSGPAGPIDLTETEPYAYTGPFGRTITSTGPG